MQPCEDKNNVYRTVLLPTKAELDEKVTRFELGAFCAFLIKRATLSTGDENGVPLYPLSNIDQ